MQKQYLVIAFGYNKETGAPYSKCANIKLDSYHAEPTYSYVDMNDVIYLEEVKPVGTIVPVTMQIG